MTRFDKAGFLAYIDRTFSYDGQAKQLIGNVVDYAMNYAADNGELRDIIAYIVDELEFEEIERFFLKE